MTTIINIDNLVCPVSLLSFTDPKVLPCGHTLDRESLIKLFVRECPICKSKFLNKSIEHFPTNWAITNLMNLSIKQPLNNILTRAKASEMSINFLRPILENEFEKLLNDISVLASNGICKYTFINGKRFKKYDKTIQKYLGEMIVIKLISIGYKAKFYLASGCFINYYVIIIEW